MYGSHVYLPNNLIRPGLLGSLALTFLGFIFVAPNMAIAQTTTIIPDGTLATPSLVGGSSPNFDIAGGGVVGTNLFHSFTRFDVGEADTVTFSSSGINRIFTRVTGNFASNIYGKLATGAGVDLYLINPNGITFGSSASLNVGGSFVASTADAVSFGAVTNLFSATNPTDPTNPLLTINTPIGLQFGTATPAPITVQGATLVMAPGKTLELSGGQINLLDTARLIAPAGSIKVSAQQGLQLTDESWLYIPNGGANSQISIDAPNLSITGGSQIGLEMSGVGQNRNLFVNTTNLILDGGTPNGPSAIYAVAAPPNSYGGNVEINTETLKLTNGAQILNSTFGPGNAGKLTINAKNIEVIGFNPGGSSSIQSASDSPVGGLGGEVKINTTSLRVANGGQIATSTKSSSAAGNLNITATDLIELSGQTGNGRSGLFANAVFGSGSGGNITLKTNLLRLTDGATINVGNALSNPNAPAFTRGTGAAGSIEVNSGSVAVLSGSLITSDAAANSAGNIKITATNASSILLDQGTIRTQGGEGNIELRSPLILLKNGSLISANGIDTAQGGNILTKSTFLIGLDNSDITANAQQGAGGRIVLTGYNSTLSLDDVMTSAFPFAPDEAGVTVLGLAVRDQLTPLNDITATSNLGSAFNGSITINTPEDDIDNTANITETQPNEARLVEAACKLTKANQFVSVGRGGLPMIPDGLRSSTSPWEDLRIMDQLAKLAPDDSMPVAQSSDTSAAHPETIIQAQGLVKGADGKYHLVAIAPVSESLLGESRKLNDTCDHLQASR